MKILSIQGQDIKLNERIISKISKELSRMRYTVAVWKNKIKDKDKFLKFENGVQTMVINSENSNGIVWGEKRTLSEILPFIKEDFLLINGKTENVPNLICGNDSDIHEASDLTIGYVVIEKDFKKKNKPSFSIDTEHIKLVDYIVEKTPNALPFPEGTPCCKRCGYDDCTELLKEIIAGKKSEEDCTLNRNIVDVKIDGNSLAMVEFVQEVISTTVCGLLGTLDGYDGKSKIEVVINDK